MTQTSKMISARLPTKLLRRAEFIVRNTTSETVRNRSAALAKALDEWSLKQLTELKALGLEIPKDCL